MFTSEEIEALPIPAELARRIYDHRTYLRYFENVYELREIEGITPEPAAVQPIHGARVLLKLLREHEPTHIAVAFDSPGKTFRDEIFPAYKANRSKVPDELSANQLERAVAGADKKHIVDARIFDRFEGKDGLSLAVEVTLQPGDKSFTEEELGIISQKIVAAAEAKGASLRG